MIRDYSDLVNICNAATAKGDLSDSIVRSKVRETIENDEINDAVKNVMAIMNEIKYEW